MAIAARTHSVALILHSATAGDPRLAELQALGLPVQASAPQGHRLLLDPQAEPDRGWCEALAELLAAHPGSLLLGRAWCEDSEGQRCDPPDRPAWVLLPPRAMLPGTELAADPAAALADLLAQAARHGLPVCEATDVAPLRRRGAPASGAGWPLHPPRALRLGCSIPGAPALELLLLAPAADLPAWRQALQPSEHLPWQVLSQPLAAGGDPMPPLRQAFAQSRAELLWPIAPGRREQLPPPALLAAVLRSLRRADLDGLELAAQGVVLRRSWWLDRSPAGPLDQLARQARRRGARLGSLGLQAPASAAAMADPDPLWPQLLAQLDRAEALLLAQQQRIRTLEQEQRRLLARLNQPTTPDDPADG